MQILFAKTVVYAAFRWMCLGNASFGNKRLSCDAYFMGCVL